MKIVGIKNLKARLSEYLRAVRQGETVLVSDRDEVIAELRPPGRTTAHIAGEAAQALDALAESGSVTRAAVPKEKWAWRADGLGLAGGTAERLLDDLRGGQ